MKEIIRVDDLRREFIVGGEKVKALRGVTFSIREGEFVTIMGASGSGKSTLLNILGCLDTPSSGIYELDGISVQSMSKNQRAVTRNRKIGFVFQNYNLLPKTTAIENVELPLLYNSAVSSRERRERAERALEAVGLKERMFHKSNQMSGGQQQRVAISSRNIVLRDGKVIADTYNDNPKSAHEALMALPKDND
ncbi:MAG: ABC transporter ATP-binding protein [Muribaculaceae bacterium]|nr:ABC transporter ATP-binding protein [Muribaculaceae bacterium]